MAELRASGAPLKLVQLEQVHLTLKFLGDTEEALVPRIVDAMRRSVAGVAPFTVRVAGTGAFPDLRRIRVLWVGLEGGEPLVGIARRLESETEPLGYPREGRDFSPHVTLARVKGGGNLDRARQVLEAHANDAYGEFPVDRIRLKKSVLTPQGPIYSTVEEVPL
ncbi:MAG: 2'-5' RNA ligase [Euryarchaeota archaeon RBG_16_68_12]|nr:MAG: 2'-5' RNA ligase [Euryarchaeota archaeon RBG_16_68_12]